MKKYRKSVLLSCLAVLSLYLCGCDNGSDASIGANGEVLPVFNEDDSTVNSVSFGYPVTVNDTVIKNKPRKVVCLSQWLAEIIYDIGCGDTISGRGSYCELPEAIMAAVDVGRPTSPDIETVIGLKPDLLITATSIPNKDVVVLGDSDIASVYIAAPRSFEEFRRIYEAVGLIFEGMFSGENTGNNAFLRIEKAFSSDKVTNIGKFVYVTEGMAVAGGNTFESSVLSFFGTNIAADSSDYSFDKTVLLENEPDTIIMNNHYSLENLMSDEVFSKLSAVTEKRVIMIDNSYFENPTSRITELVDAIK